MSTTTSASPAFSSGWGDSPLFSTSMSMSIRRGGCGTYVCRGTCVKRCVKSRSSPRQTARAAATSVSYTPHPGRSCEIRAQSSRDCPRAAAQAEYGSCVHMLCSLQVDKKTSAAISMHPRVTLIERVRTRTLSRSFEAVWTKCYQAANLEECIVRSCQGMICARGIVYMRATERSEPEYSSGEHEFARVLCCTLGTQRS